MKQICVITTTRADYGLLRPLIIKLRESKKIDFRLIVSGTHLSEEYGATINEILEDGLADMIDKIPILYNLKEGENNTSRIMANALLGAADYLKLHHPDFAIVYGDRYEMLAFAIGFANERIPLAHICGGETTEGLLDEIYRHSLTKTSILHFTNCEKHRKRVIQMGENPKNVYNVGDTCVDNALSVELISETEIRKHVKASAKDRIVLVTYHPVTLEEGTIDELNNMLEVIEKYKDFYYVFTKANADFKGEQINSNLRDFTDKHDNSILVDSLGMKRYLSLLSYTECVVGNSSSGLTEAPLFHIPTINIGNRQKSRTHGDTVIDCKGTIEDIERAFKKAFDHDFRNSCKTAMSIYGDGHAADKMIEIIETSLEKELKTEKSFYDIEFEVTI